jgi:hypothetical protein
MIYRPGRFLETFPNAVWILSGIGFLICVVRMIRGSYKPMDVFLVSSALIPPLVLLTPLYAPMVRVFCEWMPSRFVTVMPVPALAALTCGRIGGWLSAMRERGRVRGAMSGGIGVILGVAFMVVVIGPVAIMQARLYEARDKVVTPLAMWGSGDAALRGMLKDKVVLTDATTAYCLAYYAGAYAVAIPAGHGSPYINHEARNADVAAMFDLRTSAAERNELLRKYHVDYVLLNFRGRRGEAAARGEGVSKEYIDSCKAMFGGEKGFDLVYDVDGLIVYRCGEIRSSA